MENVTFKELTKTLIKYAIRAPSGHNSQPWSFQVGENKIIIVPDFNKRLEVVDSSNKELFISLGCALENLQIAALHYGYTSDYECKDDKIVVTFHKKQDNSVDDDNETLFNAIEKRHTHRGKFLKKTLNEKQLQWIQKETNESILIYDAETEGAKIICQKINKGNKIQMSDSAFKDELVEWMRFNKKHVEEKQNGLCYNVLGFPVLPTFMGGVIIKMFLKPGAQNKTDDGINASASHFCVFTMKEDTVKDYVELGTILEHFILKITSLGLAYSFSNQPCEVPQLLDEVKNELNITNIPAVIIRLGFGDEPKNYSPRETPQIQLIA